jgi:GT2 family glycosyltransferase
MRVGVIVLNYNGKDDTLLCIASLKKQTYSDIEIILVDNGSKDTTGFRELGVCFIENKDNLGFAEGNNVGIRVAMDKKVDAYFLLNNDTEIEPDCIEKLVAFSKKHPNSILGARLLHFNERSKIDHLGGFWNPKTANFDLIAHRSIFDQTLHGNPIVCDFVCGAAFFIPNKVLQATGFLEPTFFLIWEESDFCMRAGRLGFSSIYCPEAIVYHKISSSFTGGKPHTKYYWWRNRLLFMKRNLTNKEYYFTLLTTISREIFHIFKLYCIKSIEKTVLKKPVPEKKIAALKLYKASIRGFCHYFLGKLGKDSNCAK